MAKYYVTGLKKHQSSEFDTINRIITDGYDIYNKTDIPIIIVVGSKKSQIISSNDRHMQYMQGDIDGSDTHLEELGNSRYHIVRLKENFMEYESLSDEDSEQQIDYAILTLNYSTQSFKREIAVALATALARLLSAQYLKTESRDTLLDDNKSSNSLYYSATISVALEAYYAVKILKSAGYESKIQNLYNYNECATDVLPALLTGTLLTDKNDFRNNWAFKFTDYLATKIGAGTPLEIDTLANNGRIFSRQFEKRIITATKYACETIGDDSSLTVQGLKSVMNSNINENAIVTINNHQSLLQEILSNTEKLGYIEQKAYEEYKVSCEKVINLVGAKYRKVATRSEAGKKLNVASMNSSLAEMKEQMSEFVVGMSTNVETNVKDIIEVTAKNK